MEELLGVVSQFEELAAKIENLKTRHADNVFAVARLEAAYQASKRAARLIRRQVRTMR
jgi:hypothetical protein